MAQPPPNNDTVHPRRAIDMTALMQFLGSIGSYGGPEMILSPERELFHYTDLAGLLGIVQNHDLWLTNTRYSNDEEEMAHGERIAKNAIDRRLEGVAPLSPDFRQYLEELKALIERPAAQGVYICCFCRRNNLLSQWRGYGANGTGVSIRIAPGGFSHLTGADCAHGLMRFWKVFYDDAQQRKIVDTAINFCFDMRGNTAVGELAQRAADAIQFFIPTFKNPDFREEEEWRLIFTPYDNPPVKPRFRVRGTMFVPYYSLRDLSLPAAPANPGGPPPYVAPVPSAKLPVQSVTVGPSVNKALNVASIRLLLEQGGYAGIPVDASVTPFRS